MGDGRYYTYDQFFSTILLVFLIIFIILSLTLSYFRNKSHNGKKHIVVLFVWLTMAAVLKFVEELYMLENVCETLRLLQAVLIMLSYGSFTLYLCSYYLTLLITRYLKRILVIVMVVLSVVFTFARTIDGYSLLIKAYRFGITEYTNVYIACLIGLGMLVFASMVRVLIKAKKARDLDRIKFTFGVICLFYLAPLVIYIVATANAVWFLNEIEIGLILLSAITMNIVLNSKVSYGITPFAFDKIKSVMGDYVFVTDINGKIVFKNNLANQSDLFTDSDVLKMDSLQDSLNGHIVCKKDHGVEYIELNKDTTKRCFSIRYSQLKDKMTVIGTIITFVEITELIAILNELKVQEAKTRSSNEKLKEYKEIVYDLEKEKEINTLLEEIVTVQEKNMFEVLGRIDNCESKIHDKHLTEYLDETIARIQSNLSEVRKAVTAYSQHYGGN